MLISFAYRLTRKILGAVATLARRDVSSEAELLVLRHENTVLRRHVKKVCYRTEDRLWFAALSALITPPHCGGPDAGQPVISAGCFGTTRAK
jgi:putative transposase